MFQKKNKKKGRIHNVGLGVNLCLFCELPKNSVNRIDTNIAYINKKIFGLRKRL